MPMPPAPAAFDWLIRTKDNPEDRFTVHAAYFKEEGTFIKFKDQNHVSIYVLATDAVLDIGRLAEPDQSCTRDHGAAYSHTEEP